MMALEVFSSVKREKLKKAEKLKLKKDMRENLPILNRHAIRRHRLPYYEAILIESMEDGFCSTSEFLKQLIQYQDDLIEEHGIDSLVATRPQLKVTRDVLDTLYEGLKQAEMYHYDDNVGKESDVLIRLGTYYSFGSINWWWLGEQLLIQSNNVTEHYFKDGYKRHAIAKYVYGKFLFENLDDPEQAKDKLITARQLSMGKSWTARKELHSKQKAIFIESCILLCKVLIAEARKLLYVNPSKASRICAIARKRALDACDHVQEAKALMLEGLCEVQAGDFNAAIRAFSKVLIMHIKAENAEGICEARIYLGLAYLKIGKVEESLEQFNALLEYAQHHRLPYYIAQAYRFLGEYYLNQSQPQKATPILIKALNIFHDIEDFPNREQARNLAAISAGQEYLPKYLNLILKCGKRESDSFANVEKLLKWKDLREIFWDEIDELESSYNSSISLVSYEIQFGEEGIEGEMCYECMEESEREVLVCDYDKENDTELPAITEIASSQEFSVHGVLSETPVVPAPEASSSPVESSSPPVESPSPEEAPVPVESLAPVELPPPEEASPPEEPPAPTELPPNETE